MVEEKIHVGIVLKEYPYDLSSDTFTELVKLGAQMPWKISGGRWVPLEGDWEFQSNEPNCCRQTCVLWIYHHRLHQIALFLPAIWLIFWANLNRK